MQLSRYLKRAVHMVELSLTMGSLTDRTPLRPEEYGKVNYGTISRWRLKDGGFQKPQCVRLEYPRKRRPRWCSSCGEPSLCSRLCPYFLGGPLGGKLRDHIEDHEILTLTWHRRDPKITFPTVNKQSQPKAQQEICGFSEQRASAKEWSNMIWTMENRKHEPLVVTLSSPF